MLENEDDPAQNTNQFRAFVQKGHSDSAAGRHNTGVVVGIGAAVLLVIAVFAFLMA